MHIRCPNCAHPIELVDEVDLESVSCPSCGSRFSLLSVEEETTTQTVLQRVPSLAHFEMIQIVGAGQFGKVWKARDAALDRVVAIKLPYREHMTERDAALFLREAQAAARLSHENIVTVYEVGRVDDIVYIVSQYISGDTLRQRIRHKPFTLEQSINICLQVARALQHAHEQGIIHRDLKPSNILLDAQDHAYLTDFGLAKQTGAELTIAAAGHVLGTPAYMPPEQVEDGHHADGRSDIYSLGVILFEMLTGQRPFVGGKRQLLHQVLFDDAPPLRPINHAIPKDLETICLKMLEKAPERRYQSADELIEDLERFQRGEPVKARRISAPTRALRWLRRRPAIAATIALSILVVVLVPFALRAVLAAPARPQGPAVRITTIPTGANVVCIPLNARSGIPEPKRKIVAGKSPATTHLPPGDYLVEAYMNDELFHEVYRHVPAQHEKLPGAYPQSAWKNDHGAIVWPTIRLHLNHDLIVSMAKVAGGRWVMRTVDLGGATTVTQPGFYVDETETSVGMLRHYNLTPPGVGKNSNKAPDNYPVTKVSWNEAAMYAEKLGKRLLTDAEFQYLVTHGGTIDKVLTAQPPDTPIPGPVDNPQLDQLEWDRVSRPVTGLRSNVLEWTSSWWAAMSVGRDQRVVRGGYTMRLDAEPDTLAKPHEMQRMINSLPTRSKWLGFRCARSLHPRTKPADFLQRASETQ